MASSLTLGEKNFWDMFFLFDVVGHSILKCLSIPFSGLSFDWLGFSEPTTEHLLGRTTATAMLLLTA